MEKTLEMNADGIVVANDYKNNAKLQQKKNQLRKILDEKGVLQKDKENSGQKYKYFSEAAYKKLFTELFSRVGLELTVSATNLERVAYDGKASNGRIVALTVRLNDCETGYYEESQVYGEGLDAGDKALYKAYTGAIKYYLADTFLVATGDDPEVDSPEAKERTYYQNNEVATGTWRKFISSYFMKKPELELAFLEKYMISSIDDIGNVMSLQDIDLLITKMKKDLSK